MQQYRPVAPSFNENFGAGQKRPRSMIQPHLLIQQKHKLKHIPATMMKDCSGPFFGDYVSSKNKNFSSFSSQTTGAGLFQRHEAPTQFFSEKRPAVLKEKILPIEEETIQPVIHREVEKREIHEVIQPIHERNFLPAFVENKELPAQYRPQVGAYQPRAAPLEQGSFEIENTKKFSVTKAPIVEETVKKTIIEEIQPVVYRETVKPHIIKETLPIYEKIIEPAVVMKETRPFMESFSVVPTPPSLPAHLISTQPLPNTVPISRELPNHSHFGTTKKQFLFDVHQKITVTPKGTTNEVGGFNNSSSIGAPSQK